MEIDTVFITSDIIAIKKTTKVLTPLPLMTAKGIVINQLLIAIKTSIPYQ